MFLNVTQLLYTILLMKVPVLFGYWETSLRKLMMIESSLVVDTSKIIVVFVNISFEYAPHVSVRLCAKCETRI